MSTSIFSYRTILILPDHFFYQHIHYPCLFVGNQLPTDLIDTILKWIPSSDEELRLRLYTGELTQLGPAEQFLKAIIDIPYVFQRLDALLFMSNLPEEASNVRQSFATLEVITSNLIGYMSLVCVNIFKVLVASAL